VRFPHNSNILPPWRTHAISHDESVTGWIDQLKIGDERAAQEVWNRYFDKLVRLARKRLAAVPKRVADEEDVALSAFNSFCVGVARRAISPTERSA